MKPHIERELEAIRRALRELEARLRDERVELGHRSLFGYGRRGEVPGPKPEQRGYFLSTEGWARVSGSGGAGPGSVVTDGTTISGDGSADDPLTAAPLSGTINARFVNLSGSLTGKFNSLSFLSSVSHDSTLSGDGTPGNPLSADPGLDALSGTFDSAIKAVATSSQVWSQTATGLEGTELVASLPHPYPNTEYYAFVTNFSGTYNPVFKTVDKTTHGFRVVSTAPFQSGDRVDFLAISGGLGPVADGTGLASLSGTINSAIVHLSSTFDAAIQTAGGSGGSITSIWDPPSVPHEWDDEFTGSYLATTWENIHGGILPDPIDPYAGFSSTGSRADYGNMRPSWLMVQPGSVGTYHIYKSVTLPTNLFMWTRVSTSYRANGVVNGDHNISFGLSKIPYNTSELLLVQLESDPNDAMVRFVKVSGGTFTIVGRTEDTFNVRLWSHPIEGLAIQKLGTTYHGWAFTAGGQGIWLGSTTSTGSYEMVTLLFGNASTSSPGNMIMGVDFVRFVSSSVFYP